MSTTNLINDVSPGSRLPLLMQDAPGTIAPYEVGTPKGTAPVKSKSTQDYGPQNQKLPTEIQNALRELTIIYANEGQRARREEVKKCRKAREFWKGLQYQYWDEVDEQWHLPWESTSGGDEQEEPRYMFVTNYYQAFGLSIIAVLSQDLPAVRLWPQDPDQEEDRSTAKAGTDIVELIERNNGGTEMMVDEAFYLWCDGVVGGYVRYVVDGDRFGYHPEDQMEARTVKMAEEAYHCPLCAQETPYQNFMGTCVNCGGELGEENYAPPEYAQIPQVVSTTETPNGQEVITIVGGLELKRPPWAREQHQFPYLMWDVEAHRALLQASFPWAAKKIRQGAVAPADAEAQYERTTRVSLISGGETDPIGAVGDYTYNLVTYRQAWMRPWAFYLLDDDPEDPDGRLQQLLKLFPSGVSCGFAGDVYCWSRNESMDDHWRIMHALPGDGQNHPAIGESFISPQERLNTLTNICQETAEFGIPWTGVPNSVLDLDALGTAQVQPGAFYEMTGEPGKSLSDSVFESTPGEVSQFIPTMMTEIANETGQMLTSAFPALFGGDTGSNDTASGIQAQRDQAMGRIGLVWRRMKQFHADLMMLSVDVFRKNRPDDVRIPMWGKGAEFKSKWIRTADLKGSIVAYPESDAQYPTLWGQQRDTLMQLMQSEDPLIGKFLSDPDNFEMIQRLIGLEKLINPDEEAWQKTYRIIDQLLEIGAKQGPPELNPETQQAIPGIQPRPLDSHDIALATIKRWLNSDAGQSAFNENNPGFLQVEAYGLVTQGMIQDAGDRKPPSESMNFKDMPPDGQLQMAEQAGIKLNPQAVQQKAALDHVEKMAGIKAKLEPKPLGKGAI